MLFAFLFLLTEIQTVLIPFEHANITIDNIVFWNVSNPQPIPDACGKMVVRSNMLHHINNGQTYEAFISGQTGPPIIQFPSVISSPNKLKDIGVDASQ